MTVEQKLNFARNIGRFTDQRLEDAFQKSGQTLPASVVRRSGNMVTVSFQLTDTPYVFPHVTVPIFGPEYIRYPMQPGDSGIVIPADTYLGGVSGLGGGVADLTPPANLSALVFLPISNTEWESVDGNVLTMYGPEGVTIRDAGSRSTFLLTPQSITIATPSSFKVTVGGTVLTITPAGWSLTGQSGMIQDSAAKTSPAIMQAGWSSLVAWINSHQHSNGGGGSDTGTPTSPFSGDITE